MFGDHVELLFHRQRDLDRPAHQHRQRRHQRFELDIELAAEAAAEKRTLTRTRFSGQPSSRAISMRTKDGDCDAV